MSADYGDERRTEIIERAQSCRWKTDRRRRHGDHGNALRLHKRTPASVYRAQRRGGTGRKGASLKTEDVVDHIFVASAHSYVMIFTARARSTS